MIFDILSPPTSTAKAQRVSQSLLVGAIKAGLDARIIQKYRPIEGCVLVVYGPGGADRYPHVQEHPGTVVCWDVGYWDRERHWNERKFRVAINGLHPKGVMQGPRPGPERWWASGLKITQAKCRGSIMLVGNGPKSIAIGATNWAVKKANEIRFKLPGVQLAYRPKPKRPPEPGVKCDAISTGDIETALATTSLVVCRHSNVAVDACRMGVPVVCEDGAAAAIYPRRLEDAAEQPTLEQRTEFLQRLAWWQWSPMEMESGVAWKWLTERLNEDQLRRRQADVA